MVSFASTETKINAGYDFARELRGNEVVNKSWMKNGISAGAEQLFQNDKTFSFGAGAEYKSAHHSRSMTTRTGSNKLYKTTNIYGIGKYNILKKEDGSNPLAVLDLGKAVFEIDTSSSDTLDFRPCQHHASFDGIHDGIVVSGLFILRDDLSFSLCHAWLLS